jgi:hypothetical protein
MYVGATELQAVAVMYAARNWFVCYRRGDRHAGGNNVWYYTQGDLSATGWKDRQAWGYMPASALSTSVDPVPGMPECHPDMWQVNEPHEAWPFTWYGYLSDPNNTWVYGSRWNPPAGLASKLTTSPRWFLCYDKGAIHGGGNDIWYYTQSDSGMWGWVPAVELPTRKDPYDAVPWCRSFYD